VQRAFVLRSRKPERQKKTSMTIPVILFVLFEIIVLSLFCLKATFSLDSPKTFLLVTAKQFFI
jgi:NADH:ubiquinone oxidoreductase subunit 3 (subunit A)